MAKRYIAKPGTWFKAGTEVQLVDFLWDHTEHGGSKTGIFCGLRVCENPESEAKPLGIEYQDEEMCSYDEFDIVEDSKP
jgi:hypothetical protein